MSECVKSVRAVSMSLVGTRNKGVWVWRKRLGRYVSLAHPNNMKLNNSKVQWIVREKRKDNLTNAKIAESMGISVRWVQKLWSRHKNHHQVQEISHHKPMGRPQNGMPGRMEHSAVLSAGSLERAGASAIRKRI